MPGENLDSGGRINLDLLRLQNLDSAPLALQLLLDLLSGPF